MKICGYCGSQLDDSAIACSFCGRVLVAGGDPEAAREQVLQEEKRAAEQKAAEAKKSASAEGPGWQRAQAGADAQENAWIPRQSGQDARSEDRPWGSQDAQENLGSSEHSRSAGDKDPQNSWSWGAQDPQSGWSGQQWSGQGQQSGWSGQQWSGQEQQNGWSGQQWSSQGQQNSWNGQSWDRQVRMQTRTSGLAVAALVCGIASIFLGEFYCIPCILAIVLGIAAIVKTTKDRALRGRGMAIAGLVLGIVFLIIWGALLIFAIRIMRDFLAAGGDVTSYQEVYDYIVQYLGGGIAVL